MSTSLVYDGNLRSIIFLFLKDSNLRVLAVANNLAGWLHVGRNSLYHL